MSANKKRSFDGCFVVDKHSIDAIREVFASVESREKQWLDERARERRNVIAERYSD
jgi:hypothetical protein